MSLTVVLPDQTKAILCKFEPDCKKPMKRHYVDTGFRVTQIPIVGWEYGSLSIPLPITAAGPVVDIAAQPKKGGHAYAIRMGVPPTKRGEPSTFHWLLPHLMEVVGWWEACSIVGKALGLVYGRVRVGSYRPDGTLSGATPTEYVAPAGFNFRSLEPSGVELEALNMRVRSLTGGCSAVKADATKVTSA